MFIRTTDPHHGTVYLRADRIRGTEGLACSDLAAKRRVRSFWSGGMKR